MLSELKKEVELLLFNFFYNPFKQISSVFNRCSGLRYYLLKVFILVFVRTLNSAELKFVLVQE